MIQFIARRILFGIPVLVGITVIAFVALTLAPGDPLASRLEPGQLAELQRNPERLQERRDELGLDKPLPVRYLVWLRGVVSGDLGFSIQTRQPVTDILARRIPPTLALMGSALLIAISVGIPLGIVSSLKPYSKLDYSSVFGALTMMSVPNFVLGLAGIYVFGVATQLLPTSGMQTLGEPFSWWDFGAHLILPASVLGLSAAAPIMRYTRASMLESLNSDYMTTARAKGLPRRVVLLRHAFRNSLIPIVTVVGLFLPELLAGAVITEQVFAWPGMGQVAVRAAADRDPAVMMGVVLVAATSVLVVNTLVDIVYGWADPRVRLDYER